MTLSETFNFLVVNGEIHKCAIRKNCIKSHCVIFQLQKFLSGWDVLFILYWTLQVCLVFCKFYITFLSCLCYNIALKQFSVS
jgi:hypothetical protein